MRQSSRKFLIFAIAVIIIVPSVYVIVSELKAPPAPRPASAYVPAGSSISGHISFNNTSIYYFVYGGSPGLVVDLNTFGKFTELNVSSNLSSSGGNISGHHYYMSVDFGGVLIFNTTVNLTQLTASDLFMSYLGQLNMSSLNMSNLSITKFNLFFAVPSPSVVVAGLQSSVESAILASLNKQGVTHSTLDLDRGANFSLIASVASGSEIYNVSLFAYSSNSTLQLNPVTNNSSYAFQSVFNEISTQFNSEIVFKDSIAGMDLPIGVSEASFLSLLKYVFQMIVVI